MGEGIIVKEIGDSQNIKLLRTVLVPPTFPSSTTSVARIGAGETEKNGQKPKMDKDTEETLLFNLRLFPSNRYFGEGRIFNFRSSLVVCLLCLTEHTMN